MSKVVVIGGGVIGCAIAERLTLARHHVTLLERDQLGAHASGAAAGELSPFGSSQESAARSLQMFPEVVERIERDSGVNVEYHLREALLVALDESEVAERKALAGRWLDARACRELEPSLTHELLGAVLHQEAHITPPRFVRALARAAASRGADIREGAPVSGFDIAAGEVRRVITPHDVFDADWVVLAAGPWTRGLASSVGVDVDVRPQRGQLAALNAGSLALTRSIFWSTGYLVPKPDGTVIAGGTEEDSGFDDRPTVAGIATLLALTCRLVPAMGGAAIERTWAGLRPVTPDLKPIVGQVGPRNLIVATGHYRKGILLAPLAATEVASIIEA